MNQINEFERSVLAITLDECEAILAPYRRRYTEDGAQGMVAHITILYPFCGCEVWNDEAAQRLLEKLSKVKPFSLTFNGLARFMQTRVLYLDPSPGNVVVSLIRSVSDAFPDHPPYGGSVALDRVTPHATIAVSPPADDLDAVENEFVESALHLLPKRVSVENLSLFVNSNDKWWKHSELSFGQS